MQELILNGPTIVILIAIGALAVLSVRRMARRGLCDCGDRCEGGCHGCDGCSCGCPSVEQLAVK